MSARENNIQYILLIVVIRNPKMLQPNHGLDNSPRSRSPNNTCIYCCSSNTKTLQDINVHNTMEYIETQYHITLCWWLHSSVGTKEDFYNLANQVKMWPFYYGE